jgi:hypothetical protein
MMGRIVDHATKTRIIVKRAGEKRFLAGFKPRWFFLASGFL